MDEIFKNKKHLCDLGDLYLHSAIDGIKKKGGVALFGAGDLGRRMKKFIEKRGARVLFFADNDRDKWEKKVGGIPVLPPREAAKRPGVFFIACSSDAPLIAEQLKSIGARGCDTKLYLACQVLFHSRASFLRHGKELKRLHSFLGDRESKETLRNLVLHSFTFDGARIAKIRRPAQYFFSNEFAVREGNTVIDAGAYTGDTVREIVARFGPVFKEIHCFEPSRKNFIRLRGYIKSAGLAGKVIPHRLGLSFKREALHFSGSGVSFHRDRNAGKAGETVRTDTIDNLFARRRVDFIKMDIEGAEPLALKGGAQVIKRDRPRLAICVYHATEHLWTIPFYIKSLIPEYRLYLRHHSESAHETVLYAAV